MPAPDSSSLLASQIRAALRMHELGNASPYALSFAGLGNSGASFGICQSDTAANPTALKVLRSILETGMPKARAASLVELLSRHCPVNPLSEIDAADVDGILAGDEGRRQVDLLDGFTINHLLDELDASIDAVAAGKTLSDWTKIAIALWINMTGAPTTLDRWLMGANVVMGGVAVSPAAGPVIGQEDICRYLSRSAYYAANPRNLNHLVVSVEAGLAVTV